MWDDPRTWSPALDVVEVAEADSSIREPSLGTRDRTVHPLRDICRTKSSSSCRVSQGVGQPLAGGGISSREVEEMSPCAGVVDEVSLAMTLDSASVEGAPGRMCASSPVSCISKCLHELRPLRYIAGCKYCSPGAHCRLCRSTSRHARLYMGARGKTRRRTGNADRASEIALRARRAVSV